MIELHTGRYCAAFEKHDEAATRSELGSLVEAAAQGQRLGMIVNAGHGLNLRNVGPVAAIAGMHELNIGHSIMAQAVFLGLERAVRDMTQAMGRSIPG